MVEPQSLHFDAMHRSSWLDPIPAKIASDKKKNKGNNTISKELFISVGIMTHYWNGGYTIEKVAH